MLREQIRSIGQATDRPFCVNLVLDFEQDERLEVAAEERVPWVSFSFGMRRQMIARAHARGTRAMVQVASAEAARVAADAGADALIVQGVEAGGHVQSVVGLLPLLAQVSRAVSLPLLAAGGIADPVSARAALSAGATAVVMGTRFVASDECDAHPHYKARLLEAEGRDTVLTRLFDLGWDAPHRVLRNGTYQRWEAAGPKPANVRAKATRSLRGSSATPSTCRSRAAKARSMQWRCMPARASELSTPSSRQQQSSNASPLRCAPPDRLLSLLAVAVAQMGLAAVAALASMQHSYRRCTLVAWRCEAAATHEPADDQWTIFHFTQSNPDGKSQGDVPALLRRVADSIEALGDVMVEDMTFSTEPTADERALSMTVYYHREHLD